MLGFHAETRGPLGPDRASPCAFTLLSPPPRLRPTRSNVSTSGQCHRPWAGCRSPGPGAVGHEGSWPVEGTGRWIPGRPPGDSRVTVGKAGRPGGAWRREPSLPCKVRRTDGHTSSRQV